MRRKHSADIPKVFIGLLVNNELERVQQEAIVTSFNELTQHVPHQ
jgi:hypothetical protein